METEEQRDYSINENSAHLDTEGLVQRNLTSFIIGAIFVIILPVLGLFIFLHTRSSSPTASQAVNSASTSATAASNPINSTASTAQQQTSGNQQPTTTYTNTQFNYSVKMPSKWVAYLRMSLGNGYQMGFHQSGNADTPIVINTQTNPANVPLQTLVSTEFPNATAQTKTIGGAQALFVSDPNKEIASYFLTRNGNIYEISGSINANYAQSFNQMASSFTFTK